MDKQANKAGYTMGELLVVLAILSCVWIMLPHAKMEAFDYHEPIYSKQLEAMSRMRRVEIRDGYWYNQNGNINHAGTVKNGDLTCTIQLGFGRYRCE